MATGDIETAAPLSPRRLWASIALLTLVAIMNTGDRLLPGILMEPIKHDLALSDTAIGLINGFGFLIVYAVVGLPIARLSDRGAYGLVIAAALGLWSAMTFLGAYAQSGWQFALSRVGVAVGESGSAPASHAFIAANFAPARRGVPLAVLTMAMPIAIMLVTWGGAVAGQSLGWRTTFMIMGGIGIVLCPLVLIIMGRSFPVAQTPSPQTKSLLSVFGLLRKRSFLLILLGAACIAIGGYSVVAFGAAFLMRVHHMDLAQMGRLYGIASGVAGTAGIIVAGLLSDRLSARDPRWTLWVLALMITALIPFALAAFLVPDMRVALVCMGLIQIVNVAYLAPAILAIQQLVPADARACASALLLTFNSIAGGLGPLLTGMISDSLTPALGHMALAWAMLVIPAAYAAGALLFAAASINFRQDMCEQAPTA